MTICSVFRNVSSSAIVPVFAQCENWLRNYNDFMDTKDGPDWYLNEWMTELGVRQASLSKSTSWGKRKTSELCGGKQRYNRDSINEAAEALGIDPWQLLLPPNEAQDICSIREALMRTAFRTSSLRPPDSGNPVPISSGKKR